MINRNRADYVKAWGEFDLLPGALVALRRLREAGRRVIVVTNQSAVGRGLLTRRSLAQLHERMCATVAQAGGAIEDVLVCPHHPAAGCACRKPRPGLLLAARDRLGVDLERSVLVGDHTSDLMAASAAGCAAVLVLSGRTAAEVTAPGRSVAALASPIVPDLAAAVDLILATTA